MIDFTLSPALQKLQAQAREFARRELLPVAWEYDQREETPIQVLHKAYDAGLINGGIPKAYGGKGYGAMEWVVATEELSAACSGLATSIFDHALGTEPLILCQNEETKQKYLPRLTRERKLFAFATSEPTMGSDVAGMRCMAEPDGDGYVLNGTKFWITNGGIADHVTVFATVDPKSQHKGICAFVVDMNWEGVQAGRHIPKLGQRGSNTTGIRLHNVRVPRENVIAPPGEGFALAMRTFARTRPAIGAFAVGAARSAMEFAIDYIKRRRAFGSKIGDFQAIQFKIAQMYQKVETARLLIWKAAWEADQGLDPNVSASIAKLYATETAYEVADQALQIMGGYGYTRFFPIEKLLRDTRLFRIYEGTSEVQHMILAGHVMHQYQPVMPALEDLPIHSRRDDSGDAAQAGQPAWRCRMCGYVHFQDEPPEECPYCFFPATAFKRIPAA